MLSKWGRNELELRAALLNLQMTVNFLLSADFYGDLRRPSSLWACRYKYHIDRINSLIEEAGAADGVNPE